MSDEVKYEVIAHMLVLLAICAVIVALFIFLWIIILKRKNKQAALMIVDIKNSRSKLEKLDKLKTDFVNKVTHEIRTPLNAINNSAYLLAEEGDQLSHEEKVEYSNLINENCEMLSNLVDDLIDLSLISSENFDVKPSYFSVADILNAAFLMIKAKEGVKVITSCQIQQNTILNSDRDKLLRLLGSLTSNACKFTESGHIELSCEASPIEGNIRFIVSDTGPGIPKEKTGEVFRKFVQLDDWTQGSGLGLYLARRLARILGGSLFLDQNYKEGARFILDIPLTLNASS